LKNADTFGDQDPYVRFKYGKGYIETTVKYKAGKYAKWNEKFELNNVKRWIENADKFELEAMEKDIGSSDFLGSIKPIELKELCDWQGKCAEEARRQEQAPGPVVGMNQQHFAP